MWIENQILVVPMTRVPIYFGRQLEWKLQNRPVSSNRYATEGDEISEQEPKKLLWLKKHEFWSPILEVDVNFWGQSNVIMWT